MIYNKIKSHKEKQFKKDDLLCFSSDDEEESNNLRKSSKDSNSGKKRSSPLRRGKKLRTCKLKKARYSKLISILKDRNLDVDGKSSRKTSYQCEKHVHFGGVSFSY